MISNILNQDHAALVKLCKSMKPEERLVAFLNHSRLIHQVYQAGKRSHGQFSKSRKSKNTHLEK